MQSMDLLEMRGNESVISSEGEAAATNKDYTPMKHLTAKNIHLSSVTNLP